MSVPLRGGQLDSADDLSIWPYAPHDFAADAPPPLHIYPAETSAGAWWPAPRPVLAAPTGNVMGDSFPASGGDARMYAGMDPSDRSTWLARDYLPADGMIARLNMPGTGEQAR